MTGIVPVRGLVCTPSGRGLGVGSLSVPEGFGLRGPLGIAETARRSGGYWTVKKVRPRTNKSPFPRPNSRSRFPGCFHLHKVVIEREITDSSVVSSVSVVSGSTGLSHRRPSGETHGEGGLLLSILHPHGGRFGPKITIKHPSR